MLSPLTPAENNNTNTTSSQNATITTTTSQPPTKNKKQAKKINKPKTLKEYWVHILVTLILVALFSLGVTYLFMKTIFINRANSKLHTAIKEQNKVIKVQKNLETALREACNCRENLEHIIDYSPAVCFLLQNSENYPIEFITENVQQFGYQANTFYSGETRLRDIIHPQMREQINKKLKELEKQPKNDISLEYKIICKDGSERWVDERSCLRRNKQNKVTHYQGVLIDITQRKKTEKELQQAKSASEKANKELEKTISKANKLAIEAETANAIKTQFLNSINHDIRTPMNGIIGMTGLLVDSPLNDKQRDYVNTIRSCADKLLNIITTILDYAHLQENSQQIYNKTFNLPEMLKTTFHNQQIKAHAKNLELTYHIDKVIPENTNYNYERLQQIIVNLSDNAIQHTKYGQIYLEATLIEKNNQQITIQFIIKDSGSGLPENIKQFINQPLKQETTTTTTIDGLTGLGIAISKYLIAKLNGNINAENNKQGGATIQFQVSLNIADNTTNTQEIFKTDISGHNILIIDDNPTNLQQIKTLLKKWRCKTKITHGKEDTIKILNSETNKNQPFDAILIDMTLKDTDGETLAKKITKITKSPIIIITSFDAPNDIQRFKKIGIHTNIQKPIIPTQLHQILTELFLLPQNNKQNFIDTTDFQNFRILITDDNAVNRKVASETLKKMNIKTKTATDGIEAIKILSKEKFDLVLMDLQMPKLDGFETTKQIRDPNTNVLNHNLPIIAMTAYVSTDDHDHCINCGMNDFLTKPLRVSELHEVLKNWLIPQQTTKTQIPDFDQQALLKRVAFDQKLLHEVIQIYINNTPKQIQELKTALQNNNLPELAKRAQIIFSSSDNVSAIKIKKLAQELTTASQNNNTLQATKLIPKIEKSFKKYKKITNS